MRKRNNKMLTQRQIQSLLQHGVLDTKQVQKCVEIGLVSKRQLSQKKRMMKTSDGRYTKPLLTFVGNGRKTPYTEQMKRFKDDFDTLVEMYTEETKVEGGIENG